MCSVRCTRHSSFGVRAPAPLTRGTGRRFECRRTHDRVNCNSTRSRFPREAADGRKTQARGPSRRSRGSVKCFKFKSLQIDASVRDPSTERLRQKREHYNEQY
ncbi:hypothetical protein EVAR_43983_1 [Eumeta japonica]|uniref:Uncharacterized protein n=1 Tax=Eumeta variegata TaxID=151549 RepID=A0A4C1XEA1_EUMVA|nr:hypothetical protein EVAR_43983_1 [Eumeta japonica]